MTGEQPLRIHLSGMSNPRPADYDLFGQMVSMYQVLDVRLAQAGGIKKIRSLPIHDPEKVRMPESHHHIYHWPALVSGLSELLQDVRGAELVTKKPNDVLTLAKNTLRAEGNAHVSKISANLYASALYLVCLCDPSGVEVSLIPASMRSRFSLEP